MPWDTRGLRGSTLEEMVNLTNEFYLNKGLGVIQKIPTPIVPLSIDSNTRTITKAYFEKKSTVDYMGVIQGFAICFDAKETKNKSLPIKNIHLHQIEFMEAFEKQEGYAFILVHFSFYNEYFLLPFTELKKHYYSEQSKSIKYKDFDRKYLVDSKNGAFLHYLEPLNLYLQEK